MLTKLNFRDTRGVVIVETAIVLPIFILVLIGTLEFGLIFHNYLILQNASREGARYGAIGRTQSEIDQRVRDYAFSLNDPGLNVEIANAQGSRGGTLEVRATYPLPLITPLMQTLTGNPGITLAAESFVRLE